MGMGIPIPIGMGMVGRLRWEWKGKWEWYHGNGKATFLPKKKIPILADFVLIKVETAEDYFI